MGTPAYMSPEQAAGQVDAVGRATDVYGLGATLYALLTGKPPLAGTTAEVLAQARQGKVPPPRSLKHDVPRPLEAICQKAMALQPEDRYETALALADDIEHWLADEPVSAYREPLPARVARWGRRHKPWVIGAAVLLVAAVVGLAGGLWAVNRERAQTAAQRDQKEEARQQAQQAFNMLTDETVERLLERLPQMTDTDREFLRKLLALHGQFATAPGDTPEARASIGDAQFHVGLIHHKLGENKEAEAAYRAARDVQQQLANDYPDQPNHRRDLARTLVSLAIVLRETNQVEQAKQAERASRDTFQQLVDQYPEVAFYRYGLATSHSNLAATQMVSGDLSRTTEDGFRASNKLLRQLVEKDPKNAEYRCQLSSSQSNLGALLANAKRLPEAEEAFRAARDVAERLVADFPKIGEHRSGLATSHYNLARLQRESGRLREAEEGFRAARDHFARLAADFPIVPQYRDHLARTQNTLGDLLRKTARPQDAEEAYRAALGITEKLAAEFPLHSEFHRLLAQFHSDRGERLRAAGQPQQAEESYRAAQHIFQQLAEGSRREPDDPHDLAVTLGKLAELKLASRDYKPAQELLEQARPHHLAALKADPKNASFRDAYRNYLTRVAETFLGNGDHAKAADAALDLARCTCDPATDNYDAACLAARCVPLALKDGQQSADRRPKLAQEYADRAMTLLRQAVQLGYKDAARMKKESSLDALHARDDFQKLLRELEIVPARP
jgi:eukaryotic-like serine/threonine-protein kinase